MTGPVPFINLYQQEEKQGPEKGREYLSLIFFKGLLISETEIPSYRRIMEPANHQKWENTRIICPLCKHPDVHFLKETGVWVCNHCQYTWHTIEGCGLR